MSYWVRPTTADIGIRAFGRNANDLLKEMTIGMQSILLAGDQDLNSITRKTARWEVSHDGDIEILVVKWLDEVLYRCEVHDEFLLECQPMIKDGLIEAQVSFVSKDEIDFEIEKMDNCLKNDKAQDEILNQRINAQKKYKIESTPTIIINEKKYTGKVNYNQFKKAIEKNFR